MVYPRLSGRSGLETLVFCFDGSLFSVTSLPLSITVSVPKYLWSNIGGYGYIYQWRNNVYDNYTDAIYSFSIFLPTADFGLNVSQ